MDIQQQMKDLQKAIKDTENQLVKELGLENFEEVNIDDIYQDDEIEVTQKKE